MWFFYTREGTLEGPFEGELEANLQLDKYIRVMTSGLLPEQGLDVPTASDTQSPVAAPPRGWSP
jgi:hypothetical protein